MILVKRTYAAWAKCYIKLYALMYSPVSVNSTACTGVGDSIDKYILLFFDFLYPARSRRSSSVITSGQRLHISFTALILNINEAC